MRASEAPSNGSAALRLHRAPMRTLCYISFITLIDDLHTVETEMNPSQPLAVSSRLVLISVLVLLSKSLKWEQRVGGSRRSRRGRW